MCFGCDVIQDISPVPSDEFPSTGPSTPGGVDGGNRIGFYGLESSDGAWQFAGWYDSDLNLKCELRKLHNGKTYCVPTEQIVEYVGYGATGNKVRYVDDRCATAFLEWDSETACGAPPPRYALFMVKEPSGACGAVNEQQLYRLVEPINVTAGDKWYQLIGGECTVLSVASPGVYRGLLATKIAEDEFVEFTETKN